MGEQTYLYLALSISGLASFILLGLATFSAPMSTHLYFLRSSQARGVRFGTWGWCLEEDELCMQPMKLGYTWEPEIAIPITGALVLYPIASILTFFFLVSLVPVFRTRTTEINRVIRFSATSSFLISALAFVFMIAIFDTARKRFHKAGFSSQYGPLPWISLLATFLSAMATWLSFRLPKPITKEDSSTAKPEVQEARITSRPLRRVIRPITSFQRS